MPPLNDDTLVAILSQLDNQELLHASHVDRYWRSVAVGTASLWRTATLDARSVDADSRFRTILRRSAAAPLAIIVRIGVHDSLLEIELMRSLACERGRIQALDLRLARHHLEALSNILRDGLPRLVSLELLVETATPTRDAFVYAFPAAFSSTCTPTLRRLAFTGVLLPKGFFFSSVTSVEVQINYSIQDISDFEALFSSFRNMRVLTIWLANCLPRFHSDRARILHREIVSLDELHIHNTCDRPCGVPFQIARECGPGARHVAVYSTQRRMLSLLLKQLPADEHASLCMTLSDADRYPASHCYRRTAQPPRYSVHVLCTTTGRTRMVTCTYYDDALWNAISELDRCGEIIVIGNSGWKLLRSAHWDPYYRSRLHFVHTLRLTIVSLAPQEGNKGRQKLCLPALRTIVLRAQPELRHPITAHASQLLQLLRRFTTYPPNTIDVQTVAITLHGDFPYFPQHVTLNGQVPPVVGYRATPVRGRQHHAPVEDMTLDEVFP